MKHPIRDSRALFEYISSISGADDPVKQSLRQETSLLPTAGMQISPDQGVFMALLARLLGARRALEIGTFTGYSALCVAEALPPDGLLVACDVSPQWTDVARRYWARAGVADRIDLRLGPALESLPKLLDQGHGESFDLAFIDADKPNYPAYYEFCLQLVRSGGLILVDNALWGGRVTDSADNAPETLAIRQLNQTMGRDPRVDSALLAIGDGLHLARKK